MNWTMVTDYLDGLHAANLSAIYMLDMFSCKEVHPASEPPPPPHHVRSPPRGRNPLQKSGWAAAAPSPHTL